VALAPALLLLAHLLPATGAGLALRLAAAAACVLLVPGALLLRAIGWPTMLTLRTLGEGITGVRAARGLQPGTG